jgi:DNA-binding NarL/FixJ family response regulator
VDIAIIGSYKIGREGLRALLGEKGAFRMIAQADSIGDDFESIRKGHPEIVLLDSTSPGSDLEAVFTLRRLLPKTKILLLSDSPNEDFDFYAIKAGARGCVSKRADPQTLERALLAVARGEIWASHHLAARLIERVTHQPEAEQAKSEEFTEREWEILAFVAQGCRNKEIADRLCVSENTIKTHLASIYRKLRVTTRLEAALHFFQRAKENGGVRVISSTPVTNGSERTSPGRITIGRGARGATRSTAGVSESVRPIPQIHTPHRDRRLRAR